MSDLLNQITALPLFGAGLTVLAYEVGVWINHKIKTPLANPLLIADIIIISVLLLFHIPYENYEQGGRMIELFLAPATAVLAVKIYEEFQLLKENWLPVVLGAAVGSAVSMGCVTAMCRLFLLEDTLLRSLLPKSVTTAIAVPLSAQNGGVASITVAALLITGILGAVLAPAFIKIFRVNNPVAAGVAIGTSSHALGTTKALEIGDIEGAMSGIAIGIAGLITVVYSLFLYA